MNSFLQHCWLRHPITLTACDSDDGTPDTVVCPAPQNETLARLIAPLHDQLYHCGLIPHDNGYDCDVWLLPVSPFLTLLNQALHQATGDEWQAIKDIQRPVQRWLNKGFQLIRVTVARQYRTFETEQQVWGHENEQISPTLRRRARKLRHDRCDACGYTHKTNPMIFRDGNPENLSDDNLGLACPVCVFSTRLNRLGANDGVMVYLPAIAPEDISHLLRTLAVARREGSERQKEDAGRILRWLTGHRREAEQFWGTSHPGEFGRALMQAPPEIRDDMQQRLRHVVLIVNPELLSAQATHGVPSPLTWTALAERYQHHA